MTTSKTTTSKFELLEKRVLMSADLRSVDGSGNNLLHPEWGAAGTDLIRLAAADYADGISAPAGDDRASARAISNAVAERSPHDARCARRSTASRSRPAPAVKFDP